MEVEVRAHANIKDLIRNYPDKGVLKVYLLEQATLGDLFKALNVPAKQVDLVIINGKCAHEDTVLNNGNLIEFFPLLSGG